MHLATGECQRGCAEHDPENELDPEDTGGHLGLDFLQGSMTNLVPGHAGPDSLPPFTDDLEVCLRERTWVGSVSACGIAPE